MPAPTTGAERIVCPQCGSNNFPGVALCWQCGASLPPPEAAPTVHNAGCSRPTRPSALGPAGAIVVVIVMATMAVAAFLAVGRMRASEAERRMADLNALKDRLLRERQPALGRIDSAGDPTEERARREIERLGRQLEGMPGGMGGDVRLRTGGSLSADEYERLREDARGRR